MSTLKLVEFAMQFLVTLINDKGAVLKKFEVFAMPRSSDILEWKKSTGVVRVIVDIAC